MVVSLATHHTRFSTMAKQMLHWMDQALGRGSGPGGPPGAWAPSINLYEDSVAYYAVADLAGVSPKDMELRVEKEALVLVGRRETPEPAEPTGSVCLHLMEVDHGPFCRRLNLPPDADAPATEASYRNGLLWIHIPKKG